MALVDTSTGEKVVTKLPIDEIVIGNRHRNAFGDVELLAASIKSVGLLNPVTVTDGNRLVAGHRRIEACRSLGVTAVPVRFVRSINSAAKILQAERDENTCRKDMTPAELKSLTDALLEIERPAAEERRAAGLKQNAPLGPAGPNGEKGKATSRAAEAAGWSRNSYERTKRVLDAAEDSTLPESVRNVASVLAAGLADGTITPRDADSKLREAKDQASAPTPKSRAGIEAKIVKAKEMAAAGHTSPQIGAAIGIENMPAFRARHGIEVPADAVVRSRHLDSNRIVEETVTTLEGVVLGVDLIAFDTLDRARIDEWVTSLSNSLRSLNRLSKQLKEMTL